MEEVPQTFFLEFSLSASSVARIRLLERAALFCGDVSSFVRTARRDEDAAGVEVASTIVVSTSAALRAGEGKEGKEADKERRKARRVSGELAAY